MGDRYLVTGVQLGMLMAAPLDYHERNKIIQKIIDEQHIWGSMMPITEDCKKIKLLLKK